MLTLTAASDEVLTVDLDPPEPAKELPYGKGETVMIVDDQPSLVALTEETLAALGYEPVGFDSSVAALQAFRAEPQRFDLVLTDQTMPDLSGVDLAREIRRVRPELPVVLMSGFGPTRAASWKPFLPGVALSKKILEFGLGTLDRLAQIADPACVSRQMDQREEGS